MKTLTIEQATEHRHAEIGLATDLSEHPTVAASPEVEPEPWDFINGFLDDCRASRQLDPMADGEPTDQSPDDYDEEQIAAADAYIDSL